MADFGLTNTGFNRKSLEQIKADKEAAFKSALGENLNITPESPDGQIIGSASESDALLWELAQAVYNAFNPNSATGINLDNLVELNGITRQPATSSRALLNITGTPNALIFTLDVATNDTAAVFRTEEPVMLSPVGTGQVYASALDTGPISALAGTLTEIVTPNAFVSSVINTSDAVEGRDRETDDELRARRNLSFSTQAVAVIDAVFSAVANVDGVTDVTVLENDTDFVDGNGQDPHTFWTIVSGGIDADIARAIFDNTPGGIATFGTTSVPVDDIQGNPHIMKFERPTAVDIYVEVTIDIEAGYPANGEDLIKQAIVDYAEANQPAGADVINSRYYTPINTVPGHSIISLFMDVTPSPVSSADIPIAVNQIARFTIANITVI